MEINIEELQRANEIKITVAGVGGGGSNTINHLSTHGVHKSINLIALNTDAQHLNTVESHSKIQLGEKTTKGLGAGMMPEIGRKSAEESYEIIKESFRDSNIVFVATGLGGGTGTGATPIIARAAKEAGALTIAVVTKPFRFEGKQREKVAEEGLRELKEEVDSIIVIPNEKLLATVSKALGMKDSLKLVDNVLSQAVNGISALILNNSNGGLNADYADLAKIMEFKGLALIGIGDKEGEDSAMEAVKEAIESPLLDNISIKGAKGAIVYFETNEQYPLSMLNDAGEVVQQQIDSDAWFKIAWSFNNDIAPNQVKVTLVVTGFEKEILHKDTPIESNNNSNITMKSVKSNPTIALKKVSGLPESLFDNQDVQDLDYPAFLRNQRD